MTATQIAAWKNSPKTFKCYKDLFQPIEENEEVTYVSRILEKVFPSSECSDEQVAFAISICEMFLNPDYKTIQIKEKILKDLIVNNKVNYWNFDFIEGF